MVGQFCNDDIKKALDIFAVISEVQKSIEVDIHDLGRDGNNGSQHKSMSLNLDTGGGEEGLRLNDTQCNGTS